mmetsp:Transcript_1634/g.2075  ORF Transcript_1634/g.2075 Transcript_1634/m.2075 type:complete len:659 (+) Transcript_1634:104-2080(+)
MDSSSSSDSGWFVGKNLNILRSKMFSRSDSVKSNESESNKSPASPMPKSGINSNDGNNPIIINDAPHPKGIVNHRNDKAAEKLATALAAKYLFELNPSRSHKSNVHALLSRELHDLTRQALAFRTARLPPRVLCRLNAFIANLCAAVPESPLPASITRFGSASARRASEGVEGDEASMVLAQISEEDLKQRLECYISALWATANAATQCELNKEIYKGDPIGSAKAEKEGAAALLMANERADSARLQATITSFVNVCLAQAALVPNMTLLQNIRPRNLLTPLVESLCMEVLGVPDVDANTKEKISVLVIGYEKQHSFFQTADSNARRVLAPLLAELLQWLRRNEDSLVANSATEGMLAVIPEDLRYQLKNQVYYSAEHFLEVFNTLRPRLEKLPIPLHPLLEDTTMDAAQAMKDMHRERLTLNGPEVPSTDVPILLFDIIHELLNAQLLKENIEPESSTTTATNEEGKESTEGVMDTGTVKPPLVATATNGATSGGDAMNARHDMPHSCLTDHLVMRTINAASRTASGGDAFFIVQDLYGGDGVLVKQSAVTAPPIEIIVDMNGVTVRSQDSYEIYHEQEVTEAEDAIPLMIMSTAMIENIPLPEPATVRFYMSRRELSFQGDIGRNVSVGGDPDEVIVRRFLSLDASRPKRNRKASS